MTADTLAAVLWDMDGTVIDSEPLWLRTEIEMLDRYGIEMSSESHEQIIGMGLRDAAQHFRALGVPLGIDEIILEWVSGACRGLAESKPDWRPGAVELLVSLRDAGVPCALVTMATRSFADAVLAQLPQGLFRASIAGDEVEHEKPHPQPYLLGAAALGVPIERCIAIEDSPTGLRSATAAGAVAIGVPNLVPLDAAPAHALLPTLEGLDAAALRRLHAAAPSAREVLA